MLYQGIVLITLVVYFAAATRERNERTAAKALTLLALPGALFSVPYACMAAQAAHLALQIARAVRRRHHPHAPLFALLAAAMGGYHLLCDYTAVDAYWFLVRRHFVTAIAELVPTGKWHHRANFVATAAMWCAVSWWAWRHELGVSAAAYAAVVLPHHTFVHGRAIAAQKQA